jgi:PAS domain S-box-containing protein
MGHLQDKGRIMGKPLRVLIIEDSDDDAQLLLRELKRSGYDAEFERVETAEAMQVVLTEKTWDLILSDYTMPKFSALGALEVLKASRFDLPFIIISGTIGEETAVAALKAGANDFLVKGKFARLGTIIERELREAEVRRDRTRAEEQIRYHARLLRHVNDAVIATDDQFRITAWNRAAERIYGWAATEVMGRDINEILTSGLNEEQRVEARMLLQENSSFRSQRIHSRKNGQPIYVEENTIALTGSQSEVIGYVSVNRDVTERKRAEETISQLAAIVESSDDAIIGQTLEDVIVSWNPAAERLYGYSADEVIGKPVSIILPREQFDEAIGVLERLKAGERVEHFETVRVRKDGQLIYISTAISSIKDTAGKIIGIAAIERNISEHKKAEEVLRLSSSQEQGRRRLTVFAEFLAILAVGLLAFLLELNLNLFSQILTSFRLTFAQVDEILVMLIFLGLGTAGFSFRRWKEAETEIIQRQEVQEALRTLHAELETRVQERTADLSRTNLALKNEISERKQAEEALQKSEERYRFLFENNPLPMWVYDLKTLAFLAVNDWAVEKYGYTRQEFLHMTIADIRPSEEVSRLMENVSKQRPALQHSGDWRHRLKNGTIIDVEITSHTLRIDGHDAALVVAQDITERKRTEEALQEKERLLSEAQRIGHIGSWSYEITTDALQYSDEMYRLFDISKEKSQHNREEFLSLVYSADRPTVRNWMEVITAGRQVKELDFRIFHKSGELRYIQTRGAVVFDSNGNPVRFIGTAQDISERKLAEIQIRQQLEHLTALRRIDQAITSSFNLLPTLEIVLSQVLSQLQVDAADILLLNLDEQMLEYSGGQGFRTTAAQNTRMAIGESHAGRAVKERHLIHIPNLKDKPGHPLRAALLAEEGFVSGFFAPLIAKGKVQGVMELFCRKPLQPYPEWLDFLETLAGQAAIAIDNVTLFENLQLSNNELRQAYDATIEGWSKAMDLRDKETEGHTQRVTDLTLRLAGVMNVSESELVQIRRGVLLHDMGKLGIPDSILLKPGKLTDEEWEIMRKHPQFAYEMLSSITYLKSALTIPYCHHEKWDGTGYPRGLKGEQIPLEARLFSVVDVWDAVTSDRPYRKAWSKEEATQYIKDQSEKHFDPKVVDIFLNTVAKL